MLELYFDTMVTIFELLIVVVVYVQAPKLVTVNKSQTIN